MAIIRHRHSDSDRTETENSEQSEQSGWSESEQSDGSAIDPGEARSIAEVDGEERGEGEPADAPPPLEAVDLATLPPSVAGTGNGIAGSRAPDMLWTDTASYGQPVAAAEEMETITGPRAPESLWSDGEEEGESGIDEVFAVHATRSLQPPTPATAAAAPRRLLIEDITANPAAPCESTTAAMAPRRMLIEDVTDQHTARAADTAQGEAEEGEIPEEINIKRKKNRAGW